MPVSIFNYKLRFARGIHTCKVCHGIIHHQAYRDGGSKKHKMHLNCWEQIVYFAIGKIINAVPINNIHCNKPQQGGINVGKE